MPTSGGDVAVLGELETSVFEASPIAILVHDPETGEILTVNDAAAKLIGYDVDQLVEMTVGDFSPGDAAQEQAKREIHNAVETGTNTLDWRIRRSDGTIITAEVQLRYVDSDGGKRMLAYVQDVTDRRKRERVLNELQRVATEMMEAETTAEIADLTTDAADTIIDLTNSSLRLYNPETDRLEVASITESAEAIVSKDLPPYEVGEGIVGTAFEREEVIFLDDPADEQLSDTEIRSAFAVPIGSYGVLAAGGTSRRSFSEADVEFAKLLANLTESALQQIEFNRKYRERTEELETILNNAPLVLYAIDEDGMITESRGKGLDAIGLEHRELVGQSTYDVYAEIPPILEMADRSLAGESVSDIVDFGNVWMELTQEPVLDEQGEVEQVIGVAVDVTEQKEIEQQFASLSESAVKMSEVHELSDAVELVVEIAEDLFHDAIVSYWGRGRDDDRLVLDATSSNIDMDEYTDESEVVHEAGDPVWQLYEEGTVITDNEFDPDKTASDAEIRSAIFAPAGDHGLLSIASSNSGAFDPHDEQLMGIMADFLAATLDRIEYEAQIREYQHELEQSNQDLEQFAYVASHDLQEPLRMVSSYMSLLEEEYRGELDDEADEYIDYAVDGADRMREMINALLDYSRIHTHGQDPELVHVGDAVEDTLDELRMHIDEHDATVEYGQLPTVTADPTQLRQVFQNLIKNAVEHGADDGPEVTISATDDGDCWEFSVTDDGDGIPVEDQGRLFDIFQTGSASGGTGIGLAVCKRIVSRHEGDIWVDSAEGEGTTFHFTVPKAVAATGGESDD